MDYKTIPTQTSSVSVSVSPTATAITPDTETIHKPDQIFHTDESNLSPFEFHFSPIADLSLDAKLVKLKKRPKTFLDLSNNPNDWQRGCIPSSDSDRSEGSHGPQNHTEHPSQSSHESRPYVNRRAGYGTIFQKSQWSGYFSKLLHPISRVTSKGKSTRYQGSSNSGWKSMSNRLIPSKWRNRSEPGLFLPNKQGAPNELRDLVATTLRITDGFNASSGPPIERPKLQDSSGYLNDTDDGHGHLRKSGEARSTSL